MLRSYLKTAWRNLRRARMLSFVTISGLAIGLACVMLIVLFIKDEWSFDRFNTKGANIYRLVQNVTDASGGERKSGISGVPQGPAFAAEIPGIESYCRIKGWDMTVKKGMEGTQSQVLFADPSVFDLFSVEVLKGRAHEMLTGRNTVVLSDETATKYFGSEAPLGKTLEIQVDDAFEPFLVTGVVKTMPLNSSLRFDMLIPFERQNPSDVAKRDEQVNDWGSSYLNTFFLLREDADARAIEQKMRQVYTKYKKEAVGGASNKAAKVQYALQPFFSMHLDKSYFATNGLSNWSDATYSYILFGLAGLILLIACINFINITLARSMQRTKEIGVRKISGGRRSQIILQFLCESFVVTAISFFGALILVQLALPLFNEFSHKQFSVAYLVQPATVIAFGLLIASVSFLAGFYPAFAAARLRPVQTLYGRVKLSGKQALGKALVVLQFSIAIALIIGTVVFNKQFNYISHADLGYNPQNIIRLQFPWGKAAEVKQFKNSLAQESSVQAIGTKGGDWNKTAFEIDGKKTDWTYFETIDDHYLQTLQIPLAKGRYLSYNNVADTVSNCLVNASFAEKLLDKNKDHIGQTIKRSSEKNAYTVMGVVKDYHSADLKEKIEPVFFSLDKRGAAFTCFIKYVPGTANKTSAAVKKLYKAVDPFTPIEFTYMQDWLMQRYEADAQWKKIVSFSAFIAILISALGLFALTALSVQQRVKEIGIRKVLGATVANIALLFSKDFLKLVLLSLILASPVAWWVMNGWLQDFAYRTAIGWTVFAASGAIALLVALCTISFQAVKAASANPVKSLRTE